MALLAEMLQLRKLNLTLFLHLQATKKSKLSKLFVKSQVLVLKKQKNLLTTLLSLLKKALLKKKLKKSKLSLKKLELALKLSNANFEKPAA
ncbi:Uncharacterised protein [Mycobacteroides abscessus subsp. abscessus]|nr:Uncharacterised protein [Mycobacteroides abscessus subsp. abscessus]